MILDKIVMGTMVRSDNHRRIILFDRSKLVTCFEQASREELVTELWTLDPGKSIFMERLLETVVGQISYNLNPDKQSWRVSSVSTSCRGYGTILYYLAMSDIFPLFLTSDSSSSQIGDIPRRIWRRISMDPSVKSMRRISWYVNLVNEADYLHYGYACHRVFPDLEVINLQRLNKYTIRLWEEADDLTGKISGLFRELGYRHFARLYVDD